MSNSHEVVEIKKRVLLAILVAAGLVLTPFLSFADDLLMNTPTPLSILPPEELLKVTNTGTVLSPHPAGYVMQATPTVSPSVTPTAGFTPTMSGY